MIISKYPLLIRHYQLSELVHTEVSSLFPVSESQIYADLHSGHTLVWSLIPYLEGNFCQRMQNVRF